MSCLGFVWGWFGDGVALGWFRVGLELVYGLPRPSLGFTKGRQPTDRPRTLPQPDPQNLDKNFQPASDSLAQLKTTDANNPRIQAD